MKLVNDIVVLIHDPKIYTENVLLRHIECMIYKYCTCSPKWHSLVRSQTDWQRATIPTPLPPSCHAPSFDCDSLCWPCSCPSTPSPSHSRCRPLPLHLCVQVHRAHVHVHVLA